MRALAITSLWILRKQEKHIFKSLQRFRFCMTQVDKTSGLYLINLFIAGWREREYECEDLIILFINPY